MKDTCRGLAYLHAGNPPLIHAPGYKIVRIKLVMQWKKKSFCKIISIHCSLNILISHAFTAKLGDFGFALEMPKHQAGRTLVTAPLIARTDGYCPPELLHGKISPKSDVFSYGIVRYINIVLFFMNHDCVIYNSYFIVHRLCWKPIQG